MNGDLNNLKIGVVGLGYVGLPIAIEFGKKYSTTGYDMSSVRVEELRSGNDSTREVDTDQLIAAEHLSFTTEIQDLADRNFYVVTVPTPVTKDARPDFGPLELASRSIASVLRIGDIVVYESTVYPGATEEFCVPLLEQGSGLRLNQDFFVGYSPERINPGDKDHTVEKILKVTSGSTTEAAEVIDAVYGSIISAGTYRASSIKVAEAAKVIENTQRDVNIALVNELAMIFERVGIDTEEVLQVAGTKWNFLPFRPGLVGGHCIGVDPYYLTYKAEQLGYHPQMVLAGRRINDEMPLYVVSRIIKKMIAANIQPLNARILVLGMTFKENCPDFRNTRAIDVVRELQAYGAVVDVFDPWVDADRVRAEYGLEMLESPQDGTYDVTVIAVAHRQFAEMGSEGIRALCNPSGLVFDIKYLLPRDASDGRL